MEGQSTLSMTVRAFALLQVLSQLEALGVRCECRILGSGDDLWVARSKRNASAEFGEPCPDGWHAGLCPSNSCAGFVEPVMKNDMRASAKCCESCPGRSVSPTAVGVTLPVEQSRLRLGAAEGRESCLSLKLLPCTHLEDATAIPDPRWPVADTLTPAARAVLDRIVERKSISDLNGSIISGRLEKQKYLMRCSGECVSLEAGTHETPSLSVLWQAGRHT